MRIWFAHAEYIVCSESNHACLCLLVVNMNIVVLSSCLKYVASVYILKYTHGCNAGVLITRQ